MFYEDYCAKLEISGKHRGPRKLVGTQIEKIHIVTEDLTHIRFAIYNTFMRYFS